MKSFHLLYLTLFVFSTIIFKRKKPILGTIIVTDKCNLSCKHCAVNNVNGVIYPYRQIKQEMDILYQQGIRVLFFYGGEAFLWRSQDKTIRDLVVEAEQMGFFIVNVVTNGTYGKENGKQSLFWRRHSSPYAVRPAGNYPQVGRIL
jgi:MoaA/NifB/PqqE/SkfB family radical SAM enzyme